MRQRAGLALLLAAFACAAGAIAVPASAAPEPEDEGAVGGFVLKGSNGYRIFVFATAPRNAGGKGGVVLVVGRKGSAVLYDAPATVTPTLTPSPTGVSLTGLATSIHADLGALSRIDVELKPSGVEKTERSPCGGRPATYAAGTYEGTVEFHGEEGFTEASATGTPLSLWLLSVLSCAGNSISEARGAGLPGAALLANSGTRHEQLELQVNQNRKGARVRLSASLRERRGEVKIERQVNETAPSSAFSFDPHLRTASLAPPDPFSGAATFVRAAPSTRRFRGNLAVDFPGRSNVALTGAAVRAHLVHAKFGKNQEGIFHPEPEVGLFGCPPRGGGEFMR